MGPSPLAAVFGDWPPPGKSFFTVPVNHFNCAVAAYTHNIPLERKKETEQTLKMIFDVGYVKVEEIPQIPRLPKTLDAILFACKPSGAVLLNEAASRAGIASGAPALDRPTCMALPATLQTGAILSLGCIGNRVYTGLGEDELYFVVRGKDLTALPALDVISGANSPLRQYAQSRRTELPTT